MVTVKRYIRGIRRPFVSKGWWGFGLSLLVAVALMLIVHTFLFTQVEMRVTRPELGLLSGDRVLVNRMSYGVRVPFAGMWGYHRWGKGMPERGEMVVFDYPGVSDNISVDRISGLPGDTIWLDNEEDAFFVVPQGALSIGTLLLPDSCLIGHPLCVSFSVDAQQPFYRKLRPKRFFITIE